MRIPFSDSGYWIEVAEGKHFAEVGIYRGNDGPHIATWYVNSKELLIINPDETKHNTGDLRITNIADLADAISRMPDDEVQTSLKFIKEGAEFTFDGKVYTKKSIVLSDDEKYNCVFNRHLTNLNEACRVYPYPMPSGKSTLEEPHSGQGYCGSPTCMTCNPMD
jgi:hypothetical protein